jgi:hypothetical protein
MGSTSLPADMLDLASSPVRVEERRDESGQRAPLIEAKSDQVRRECPVPVEIKDLALADKVTRSIRSIEKDIAKLKAIGREFLRRELQVLEVGKVPAVQLQIRNAQDGNSDRVIDRSLGRPVLDQRRQFAEPDDQIDWIRISPLDESQIGRIGWVQPCFGIAPPNREGAALGGALGGA